MMNLVYLLAPLQTSPEAGAYIATLEDQLQGLRRIASPQSAARIRSGTQLEQAPFAQCRFKRVQIRSQQRGRRRRAELNDVGFTKDADSTVRHFYSANPRMGPEIKERGIDLLAPLLHFMDLTTQGREDWYASLAYEIGTLTQFS